MSDLEDTSSPLASIPDSASSPPNPCHGQQQALEMPLGSPAIWGLAHSGLEDRQLAFDWFPKSPSSDEKKGLHANVGGRQGGRGGARVRPSPWVQGPSTRYSGYSCRVTNKPELSE